jgi:hypothetical protein
MDREEGLGKNSFYKDASSRKALKFPVENVSTEISKGNPFLPPRITMEKSLFFFFVIFVSLENRGLLEFVWRC